MANKLFSGGLLAKASLTAQGARPCIDTDLTQVWGSGWTPETDPVMKGWRVRPAFPGRGDVLLVGRPGVAGCATVRAQEGGLDVAVYSGLTPKEIVTDKHLGAANANYGAVLHAEGWGRRVLAAIARGEAGERVWPDDVPR